MAFQNQNKSEEKIKALLESFGGPKHSTSPSGVPEQNCLEFCFVFVLSTGKQQSAQGVLFLYLLWVLSLKHRDLRFRSQPKP